jgi:hypothetical protein
MDAATWATLILPALALIAIGDSLAGFSVSLSRKLGLASGILAHFALLLVSAVIFDAGLHRAFPEYALVAVAIIDYVDPREHWFSLFVAPKLLMLEILLVPCSAAIVMFISIRQRRSALYILLSMASAFIGSVGTIVWVIRGNVTNRTPELNNEHGRVN